KFSAKGKEILNHLTIFRWLSIKIRRFDWPAFLRALGNRPDKSPWNETYTAAQSTSVSKIPRLHSRSVRSDFRNGRSLRYSSSNLIRSAERDSDGFLKLESLDFSRHHPLPKSVVKNATRNQATKSDKKRQRICHFSSHPLLTFRRHSPLFVTCNCRHSSPLATTRG